MPRRSSSANQADVTRLIKGAVKAGVPMEKIAGVKMTRDGVMIVFGDRPAASSSANEWDEVLA